MKINLHVLHEQMMMNFTCILVSTCYIFPHVRFAFVTFHLWLLKIAKSLLFSYMLKFAIQTIHLWLIHGEFYMYIVSRCNI